MSRKDDLERAIRESYDIVRQYENIIRTSDRPEEKARARRIIQEQRALIAGYQAQIDALTGNAVSGEAFQSEAPLPFGSDGETGATSFQSFEPEMVLIPAGEFLMGSDPTKDPDAREREQPQHTLHLPDYYLARTPVTNAQYLAFVQATDLGVPAHWVDGKVPLGMDNHPVGNVSWHDALAYCRWLAQITGKPYGLPSEAEWEKAARDTDGRIYPWGDDPPNEGWYNFIMNADHPLPVGAYPRGASHYGLLDMAGNVWEWTISLEGGGKEKIEPGKMETDYGFRVVIRPFQTGWHLKTQEMPTMHPTSTSATYSSCAYLDADEPHALLRREGEPGSVQVRLNEVRYLIDALCLMAAEMAMVVAGDDQEQE